MRWRVVDTNVLVVANGDALQADQGCRLAAEKTLRDTRDRGSLVLADAWRILREYKRQTDRPGQLGVGSRFFMWAARLSGGIRQVTITVHPQRGFVEFPQDSRLAGFDRADRKFVAVTVASGRHETELVNATDSDYSDDRAALSEAGVFVNELCPQMIRRHR